MAALPTNENAAPFAAVPPLPALGTHFPHFGVAHGDDFDAEGLARLLPLRHVGLHCPCSLGAAWVSPCAPSRPVPQASSPNGGAAALVTGRAPRLAIPAAAWQQARAVGRQGAAGGRRESRDARAGRLTSSPGPADAALVTWSLAQATVPSRVP